jgi:hypothetical protein
VTQARTLTRAQLGDLRGQHTADARELVDFLRAAFSCLDAYEAMRTRSRGTIARALVRHAELDPSSKRYLKRVLELKRRHTAFTFERFWPIYFSR